jgi:Domain of unknown function (DUF4386)
VLEEARDVTPGGAAVLAGAMVSAGLRVIASIFWGLWLFPFGRLVVRSRFIPAIFGWMLMVAGAAYLAAAFATLVAPSLLPYVSPLAMPLEIAEVPIVFWLVIWGARTPQDGMPAPPAPAVAG